MSASLPAPPFHLTRDAIFSVSRQAAAQAEPKVPEQDPTHFRATPDLTPRRIRGASGRLKLVFNPKEKKNSPGQISYCQHAALEWQFVQADGHWLCALTPTYHYTRDGYRDSVFLSELPSGIKRLDRTPAVYQQTRMWAHRSGRTPRPSLAERGETGRRPCAGGEALCLLGHAGILRPAGGNRDAAALPEYAARIRLAAGRPAC
jgi:hypothetical protein